MANGVMIEYKTTSGDVEKFEMDASSLNDMMGINDIAEYVKASLVDGDAVIDYRTVDGTVDQVKVTAGGLDDMCGINDAEEFLNVRLYDWRPEDLWSE